MSLFIGIISYMPDTEIRQRRLEGVKKQLEWVFSIYPQCTPYIVAQNYTEAEKSILGGCIVNEFSEGIGPSAARNILLHEFYNTDCDFMLMMDDDTIAYPHYHYEEFMQDIEQHPEKFKGVDGINALEPEFQAYKGDNLNDPYTRTHYKLKRRQMNSGNVLCFVRNINKYYNKCIYFNELNPVKHEGAEDIEFILDWTLAGLTWYVMQTWIRKLFSFNESTLFGNVDTHVRKVALDKCLDKTCAKYSKYGVKKLTSGSVYWKDFNERYNHSESVLYIEREKPIEFAETEKPKENKLKRRLF